MRVPEKLPTTLLPILMMFFVLGSAGYAGEKTDTFEKHYAERLQVADYQGAVELALERYKDSGSAWDAVQPLGNAYLLNFEPSKAVGIFEKYLKRASAAKPVAAYYAAAAANCATGNYERAYRLYEIAQKADPDQVMQTTTLRLVCRMEETAAERSRDVQKREAFKASVKDHLDKTKTLQDGSPRAKAVLALMVLHDRALAGQFAREELILSSRIAEKNLGDKDAIPAETRGFVALFLALADDKRHTKSLVLCSNNCTANLITLNTNDLLYLSRCFAVFRDMASVDAALRTLWGRLKTDEQKGRFFKYVLEENAAPPPWKSPEEVAWVRKEYARYLTGRRR